MNKTFPTHSHRVLVDSSAYFVLANVKDGDHNKARSILRRANTEHWRLFTTNFVLAETHALLLKRLNRLVAVTFVGQVYQGSTTIVRVSEVDERRAWEIITRYDDKDFSLTDATSFAVMERLGIAHVFTFDHHFAQYGFVALTTTAG